MRPNSLLCRLIPGLLVVCSGVFAAEPASKSLPAQKAKPAASAAPSTANGAATPAAVFARVDGNQDNRISLVESRASAALTAAFPKLDSNADGFLTTTEFAVWEEAGNMAAVTPAEPEVSPSGSRGAQHMPKRQ